VAVAKNLKQSKKKKNLNAIELVLDGENPLSINYFANHITLYFVFFLIKIDKEHIVNVEINEKDRYANKKNKVQSPL
jgi:hypothetical protein